MILVSPELDTHVSDAPKPESHSIVRAEFFKTCELWDTFVQERDRFKVSGFPPCAGVKSWYEKRDDRSRPLDARCKDSGLGRNRSSSSEVNLSPDKQQQSNHGNAPH